MFLGPPDFEISKAFIAFLDFSENSFFSSFFCRPKGDDFFCCIFVCEDRLAGGAKPHFDPWFGDME